MTSLLSRHRALSSALLPECPSKSNLHEDSAFNLTYNSYSKFSIFFQNYDSIFTFFPFYLSKALTSFSKTFLLYFILYFFSKLTIYIMHCKHRKLPAINDKGINDVLNLIGTGKQAQSTLEKNWISNQI